MAQKLIKGIGATKRFVMITTLRMASLLLGLLACSPAQAELVFDTVANRYHLDGSKARNIISIQNSGQNPLLLQITLTQLDKESTTDLPISASPFIFVLEAGESKPVEFFYLGEGFPSDRESLFMMKVLELPKVLEDDNQVQMVIIHHMKMFWRPKGIHIVDDLIDQMSWMQAKSANHFIVKNDSANYMTLSALQLQNITGEQVCNKPIDHFVLPPHSALPLNFLDCTSPASTVKFEFIRDNGKSIDMLVRPEAGKQAKALRVKSNL